MLALRLPSLKFITPQWRLRPRAKAARAKRVVVSFLVVAVAVNVALSIGMDTILPELRDGEYVSRRKRIETRIAANPGRPLTLVLGSSRTVSGISPLALPDHGALVMNAAQVGSGPLLQLLTLQRLLHDGIVPTHVVLEFWPPFLYAGAGHAEFGRIDPHRYFASDEPFIRAYHPQAEEILRLMREIRRTPVWNHRQRTVSYLMPSWLKYDARLDHHWACLDAAGWMQGHDILPESEHQRQKKIAEDYYKPLLPDFRIDPLAARAQHDLLALCKARGISVTLIWLPESSDFRSWCPPHMDRDSMAFLENIQREFGVPTVIARDWMPDQFFLDGYHLTRSGAIAITRRLAPYLNPE